MGAPRVTQLESKAEWLQALPVLQELRTHLQEETYLDWLAAMQSEGYRLFGLYEDEALVAVAGVVVHTNFYYGRHAYIYDLVVRSDRRGDGLGTRLMATVEEWATERGCETIVLESGLWRDDAHRFYETNGFEKYCYTFKKELE